MTQQQQQQQQYEENKLAAHFAAATNNLEALANAISGRSGQLNKQDGEGKTPLFYAVSNHHIEAMKFLVTSKAKVNIADATGQVPLHIAAFDGFVPGVRLLIEHGAKANTRDVNGRLPLHLCTNSQDTGCLMALLKEAKKDQVNARDHEGMTPLHWVSVEESIYRTHRSTQWG